MEIKCIFDEFSTKEEKFYRCLVKEQKILEYQELQMDGQHVAGKTNKDVTYAAFDSCTITKVPQGLTIFFPNLKVLTIGDSMLKKVSKNDLIEYKNLEQLWFGKNEIEFLPASLLEGFKNLKWISFYGNKLEVVAPNILDGLDKLKYVDFRKNSNYGKFFSTNSGHKSNAKLDEVKTDLRLKYQQNAGLYAEYMEQQNPESTYKLKGGILADIKAFIQDESTKDYAILINGLEFKVHKFLLAARSPKLAENFRNRPRAQKLELIGISVEDFEKILKFLYTDEFPIDIDNNFINIYRAAEKLQIQELKEFAVVKIINMITDDNAEDILKLSNEFGNEEMRFKAFAVLKKKYPNFNFKAELAVDMAKLDNFIKAIKQKEKIDKVIEKMFI